MRTTILVLVAALSLAACGGPGTTSGEGSGDVGNASADAIDDVHTTLEDALVAAKSYGRRNLGHYRQLNHRRLTAEGFVARDGVRLTVYVTHGEYCFTATHTGVPAAHRWHTASVDSRMQRPAPGDGCAARSRGAAGWVCRLPAGDA